MGCLFGQAEAIVQLKRKLDAPKKLAEVFFFFPWSAAISGNRVHKVDHIERQRSSLMLSTQHSENRRGWWSKISPAQQGLKFASAFRLFDVLFGASRCGGFHQGFGSKCRDASRLLAVVMPVLAALTLGMCCVQPVPLAGGCCGPTH